MSTRTTEATAEAEIRALMENWLSAVRAQDIKGIVSHYRQISSRSMLCPSCNSRASRRTQSTGKRVLPCVQVR
jgi:hypothetical protein